MRLTSIVVLLAASACARGDDPPARADGRFSLADSGAAAAASQPDTLPAHAVVLPDSFGPELMRQCSRSAPQEVRGFWTPGPAEVNAFEKALAPKLQAALDSIGGLGEPLLRGEDYVRQYVGVVTRDGRRIVYVNADHYPAEYRVAPDGSALAEADSSWRRSPQMVCDGGHYFFGAEYDPATGDVYALYFNVLG